MRKHDEMIYMVAQYVDYHLDELHTAIADWTIMIRLLDEPQTFQVDQEEPVAYDPYDVISRIEQVSMDDNFWWRVESKAGKFNIHVYNGTLYARNLFNEEYFFTYEQMIFDYFDHRMADHGLYGYLRSYDEYLYNNTSRLEERLEFETPQEVAQLPKMLNRHHREIVDCNQLAGYDIFFKGLCLTSCWKMYFSNYYYRLIPKQILEEVHQVEANEQLGNDMLRITLYKDPRNWEKEVNQKSQRMFRDQMGYDQLAWNNGVGILRDPYIEYAFGDNSVHSVQYLNKHGQPTQKKKATQFITRTWDYIQNKYEEHQMVGTLNSQAYFPWIDELGQKMMNYRVINPDLATDSGLDAYEYYIRNFLELELENDERYEKFTSVLRFYIPKNHVKQLPVEELRKKMPDVTFKEKRLKHSTPTFDLRKGKNHLRVIFMDYDMLDFTQGVQMLQSNEDLLRN
ncbi:MAG: hypothetical protein LBV67_02750 [Streptococcaceae bacterium]|jgi:hypothetical protein|nr:hypothetical protein [Streptococcaceae bacterium]